MNKTNVLGDLNMSIQAAFPGCTKGIVFFVHGTILYGTFLHVCVYIRSFLETVNGSFLHRPAQRTTVSPCSVFSTSIWTSDKVPANDALRTSAHTRVYFNDCVHTARNAQRHICSQPVNLPHLEARFFMHHFVCHSCFTNPYLFIANNILLEADCDWLVFFVLFQKKKKKKKKHKPVTLQSLIRIMFKIIICIQEIFQ